MNNELISQLHGTDVDKETSLFEYGLLIAQYTEDGSADEYFAVYQVEPGRFDTGFIHEKQLNDLINGHEWASEQDIEHFLSSYDMTKEEWLGMPMVYKLQDCLGYWGYLDIMGDCHDSITAEKARELYLSE